jgi:mRNA-degrading endonuclease YafQ of YafQ-DinJ toxin-antitoxin module
MNLRFKKSFSKSYKKLSSSDKERVDIAMLSFQLDPFQKELINHALKGGMQ